jgi:hypothetical protein
VLSNNQIVFVSFWVNSTWYSHRASSHLW